VEDWPREVELAAESELREAEERSSRSLPSGRGTKVVASWVESLGRWEEDDKTVLYAEERADDESRKLTRLGEGEGILRGVGVADDLLQTDTAAADRQVERKIPS
jgi:hypothetical protein